MYFCRTRIEMTEIVSKIKKPKSRLKFIDMARSMAILLMLEGHFVDNCLADVYRDESNSIFYVWQYIRGFTAPIFLTVTGLIFVYLLIRNQESGYLKNIRIRKGYKRVIELIFWGYIVQWYAFHVLEAIAFGILTILIIYGIYKLIRVIPLWVYFFIAGVTIFALYKYLLTYHGGKTFIEEGLMNGILKLHGSGREAKYWFPIIPSIGYTMFGAMLGALLHDLKNHVRTWYFPTIMFTLGALFYFFAKDILHGIDVFFGMESFKFVTSDSIYVKVGMVFMELSVLVFIDNKWGDRIREGNLFLKVGQNTLTIYVLHMIILYGSFFGLGINDRYYKNLGPWEVALGAALFVAFFVVLIRYLDLIKDSLSFILDPIKKFFDRLFRVGR